MSTTFRATSPRLVRTSSGINMRIGLTAEGALAPGGDDSLLQPRGILQDLHSASFASSAKVPPSIQSVRSPKAADVSSKPNGLAQEHGGVATLLDSAMDDHFRIGGKRDLLPAVFDQRHRLAKHDLQAPRGIVRIAIQDVDHDRTESHLTASPPEANRLDSGWPF